MCFEIFGFDIILDDKANPWVLEVNQMPSFSTDTPLDFKIKKGVIADTIALLNLNYKKRIKYKALEKIKF
jgi:tubulin polyglutamylase TTLL6/13